ncbi:hypothetical protein AbraIFM66951_003156 [Aspergillus brasiliensis]|uniref:DUF7600 domain-containing protein n=1 Tax=Aspergillus brasiliensis TaxID=319629 RepID=A0A9W5Z142_9EURO|nr:hypothetical protein AbraCBS73388_002478 [Aspergillus brasiliensis]GKZ50165.1 hypothetical protein AbraIFM66951_003156 [Aspergillus brasiliensis]
MVAYKTRPMSLPQGFWRSRFYPGFEMGFAFPLATGPDLDWRRAYFNMNRALDLPQNEGLKNRRRIWNLVSSFADLIENYTVRSEVSGRGIFYYDDSKTQPIVERLSTQCITTEEKIADNDDTSYGRLTYGLLKFGSRTIHDQRLVVPLDYGRVTRVEVFLVTFASKEYIAGLRFTLTDTAAGEQQTRLLGYTTQKMEHVATLASCDRIAGFGVGLSAGGIVSFCMMLLRSGTSAHYTKVIGKTEPKESDTAWGRLVPKSPVTELHILATFDDFKMAGIGISDSPSPTQSFQSSQLQSTWTPSRPRRVSYLLPRPQALPSQLFNRILNIDFGGERGERLARLTRVVAHVSPRPSPIVGLSFYYDGLEPLHFGRQGMIETSFLVNGPNGERIQSVAYEKESGTVVALRMLTNFGGDVIFLANRFLGPYGATPAYIWRTDWRGLVQEKPLLEARTKEIIVGFTSVLQDTSGSFQTFGVQCEKANAMELQILRRPERRPRYKEQMPGIGYMLEGDIGGFTATDCREYNTAPLDGVRKIRISCGQHGRPCRSGEISGLWLEYSSAYRPVILGQWITEVYTITLPSDEPITHIRIWLRGARHVLSDSRPFGRLVRIEVSTSSQSDSWPPGQLQDESDLVCLAFPSNYLEKLSWFMWALSENWDFPCVIMAPSSRAHRLVPWVKDLRGETHPWMAPQNALWTLENGTDRLVSIAPLGGLNSPEAGVIGGLRFSYESGRTIYTGSANGEPVSPGVTFNKQDRLCKLLVHTLGSHLLEIYFTFRNVESGQVTTRSLNNSAYLEGLGDTESPAYDTDRYVIDIDQRTRQPDFLYERGGPTLPEQMPDGEIVGLCVFNSGYNMSVGLVLLQENSV